MDLDTYNQTLNNLKTQLTRVMDELDALDPADDRYESLNDKMISIQNELIALDAKYNAERQR
jgi:predicted  nucleic acid-binding Zn-ribbon protein